MTILGFPVLWVPEILAFADEHKHYLNSLTKKMSVI